MSGQDDGGRGDGSIFFALTASISCVCGMVTERASASDADVLGMEGVQSTLLQGLYDCVKGSASLGSL